MAKIICKIHVAAYTISKIDTVTYIINKTGILEIDIQHGHDGKKITT